MSSTLQVIFVHEAKEIEPRIPITLLPMGVPSMADWLERSGHRAGIVHHAIERALDPGFDVCRHVRSTGARLVCLDLHWHQQSRAVIELARMIRHGCPGVEIVLGGYTASACASEIIDGFECVDYVIRGDGEVAIVALVEALERSEGPGEVPNLTWRKEGRAVENTVRHVNSPEDLGRFSFCRFELLRHHEIYNQAGIMEGRIGLGPDREPGIFYCNIGRGCAYNCLFCGGSARAQEIISGRRGWIYRPVDAMIRDLRAMAEHNLGIWYNTFHPSTDESHFLELFGRIRAEGIRIGMIHECGHLPSERFVTEFARTFGPGSRMDFVLMTGSEALRRRNRDCFFGNEELLGVLDLLERRSIRADLCFLTGLPHEEPFHVEESVAFAQEVRRRYPNVEVNAEILAIEPLSTMSLEPEACGIVAHARTFMDYYEGHAEPGFVGYAPGGSSVERAAADARAIVRGSEKPLVQLHDVSLWDDVMRNGYGLGVPSLISHARSVPEIDEGFAFEHRAWRSGTPGGREPTPDEVAGAVIAASPLVAGFTLVTWSEGIFLEAIRRVKRQDPGVLIACGGPLATGRGPSLMQEVPQIDFLVTGYGEKPLVAILDALGRGERPGKVPGLYVRHGDEVVGARHGARSVLAPHEIPSPYRAGLVDLRGMRTMHVEWSRGCAFDCAYCSWANALHKMKPASRDRILDDIACARENGISEIVLNNSTINHDTAELEALCEAMAGSGRGSVEFTAFLRHELVDEEQLAILGTVPFRSLITGLQTDDAPGLEAVGRPPLDRDRFEWVVREIASFSRPGVQIITGLPGDSYDKFFRRLDWLESLDCDVTVFPLQVTPGSRMWRRRRKLGIDPSPEHQYYVLETREMTARETHRCAVHAARTLDASQGIRTSHGLTASPAFLEGIVRRRRAGRPLVQLHHANVFDAGMNFGLGVPFLISHCRSRRRLAARYEFEQVSWRVDQPDRFACTLEEMVDSVLEDPPAVAGFSLQPWCYRRFLDVIREVRAREPGIAIVVGGGNASIEEAGLLEDEEAIDYLVTGEGEVALAGLLEALAGGEEPDPDRIRSIGNLCGRTGGTIVPPRKVSSRRRSLDHCGAPLAEGLVHLTPRQGNLNVEWTRGCPNRCTYCAWPRGRRTFRRFSEGAISADVAWALGRGFETLLICDAAINYETELLEELCAILGRADPGSRLGLSGFVQWDLIDERQVEVMSPLRWSRIMVGLQTTDDAGLRALGRRPFDRDRFEAAVELLKRLAVPYIEYMTGVPGDTSSMIRERIEYALSLGCRVSMFPLLATKGTIIWRRCLEQGIVVDPDHQYVVRELPTMGFEEYRGIVDWASGLGLSRHELEIVGYEFMREGDPGARDDAPHRPREPVHERDLRTEVSRLLDRFPDRDVAPWRPDGRPESIRQAQIQGLRITFAQGDRRLGVDAFSAGDLSSPLASGSRLAFCPAPGADPELGEAVRNVCMLLARLDGGRG